MRNYIVITWWPVFANYRNVDYLTTLVAKMFNVRTPLRCYAMKVKVYREVDRLLRNVAQILIRRFYVAIFIACHDMTLGAHAKFEAVERFSFASRCLPIDQIYSNSSTHDDLMTQAMRSNGIPIA